MDLVFLNTFPSYLNQLKYINDIKNKKIQMYTQISRNVPKYFKEFSQF